MLRRLLFVLVPLGYLKPTMSFYASHPSSSNIYGHLWIKYRPALLKLMSDANVAPQQYKFSKHEIKNVNPNEKGGHTFVLKAHKGKAVNDVRKSVIAKDLLAILQQSNRATELLDSSTYEFKLDKNFILHVTRETPLTDEVVLKDASTEITEEVA